VLAIFMGGLGLGGALLGRRVDADRRPLDFYARLELLIALSAAVTPLLVGLARWVYVALGGSVSLGLVLGSGARLVLSALVLAVPTLLMGGTLPAAARAAETAGDVRRRALAVL
jgi:spermidine synthase